MMRLGIYIISAFRPKSVRTHEFFSDRIKKLTTLVVPRDQLKEYAHYANEGIGIRSIPTSWPPYIPAARQWVMQHAPEDWIFQMDDDLEFYVRDIDYHLHIIKDSAHIDNMIFEVKRHMPETGLVSISNRYLNNLHKEEFVDRATNHYQAWCIDKKTFFHEKITLMMPVRVMEDIYLHLQWLQSGHVNRVLFNFAKADRGPNAEGGCSTYRDNEKQTAAVTFLRSKYPHLVNYTKRKAKTATWQTYAGANKTADGYVIRTEHRIAWKKAFVPKREQFNWGA